MWSDSDTDIDFLNYSEVAEMVSELIADPTLLPLSLGVFGGWGIGKSSTLRLVERELLAAPENYLIVKFDAWLYQDFDDARAALMGVISTALAEAAPQTLKEKAFAPRARQQAATAWPRDRGQRISFRHSNIRRRDEGLRCTGQSLGRQEG